MHEMPAENPEEVEVRLKPFLGLAPTTYLPILYGVLILLIVFLLLLLPGLVRPGSVLEVSGAPAHCAVAIDGIVRGTSEDDIFVSHGLHVITVSRPGFVSEIVEVDLGRRLFFSLFFPRRQELAVELKPSDMAQHVHDVAREFSAWALVGEGSGQYQLPPLARELGSDLGGLDGAAQYREFVDTVMPHVNSEAQLTDLLAGALLVHAGGSAPGPYAIAAVMQQVAAAVDDTPGMILQLRDVTTGLRVDAVADSPAVEAAVAHFETIGQTPRVERAASVGTARVLGGVRFVSVPAGGGLVGGTERAERGGDIPYLVEFGRFLVSQTEITVGLYSEFVQDDETWSLANRDALVAAGLADADYLRDWESGVPSATLPVRYVSAYAAEAFALWLTARAGFDIEIRLPSEAEWDYLAALDAPAQGVFASVDRSGPSVVSESYEGYLGLFGLAGNVWEWTADGFAAHSRRYLSGDAGVRSDTATPDAAQRVVRGGGWATSSEDFTIDDRGSMPAEWCSATVGFRLVAAE